MERKVAIYSGTTGERLCQIEAPQKGWDGHFIPLPPFGWVVPHTAWENPDAVVKWAWLQAWLIVLHINSYTLGGHGLEMPEDTRHHCAMCGQDTYVPVARHWSWWLRWAKLYTPWIGFVCSNQACGMFNVLLPNVLLNRIYEMPIEYVPLVDAGLAKSSELLWRLWHAWKQPEMLGRH